MKERASEAKFFYELPQMDEKKRKVEERKYVKSSLIHNLSIL
jgi:hypothetical protein